MLNRRAFTFATVGLAVTDLLARSAFGQSTTRSVTTSLGTYDIPTAPQRVVTIDSRLDLQPALALGLPVVGYGHSTPGPWVPVPEGLEFYGSEINFEQVLASDPDLIICADYDPDSVWWPINTLKTIAPVVPTSGDKPWKAQFNELATLLGFEGAGADAIAEYDALIAQIKARHGDKLQQKAVVSIQPDEGKVWLMNGSVQLQPQVLADLGARTIAPAADQLYDGGEISAENLGDRFGDVAGLLMATGAAADMDGIAKDPLWQRLPAVASGAVVLSNGNINYGSIYSAMQVAKLVDELYGKIG